MLIPSSMVMDTIRKHICQCALDKQQTVTKHDKRNEKVSMFFRRNMCAYRFDLSAISRL